MPSSSVYQSVHILLDTVTPPSVWEKKGPAQMLSRTISGNSSWAGIKERPYSGMKKQRKS